jgi:hypothetical protein
MIEESSDGEVDGWRLFPGASRAAGWGVCGGEMRCSPFVGDMVQGIVEGIIDLGS